MAEYIKRDAFLEDVEKRYCLPCKEGGKDHNGCMCRACWVDDMRGEVIDAPAADVAPVVHGRCPVCSGKEVLAQDCDNGYCVEIDAEQAEMTIWQGDTCLAVISIDFCPNCGAKMDGDADAEKD